MNRLLSSVMITIAFLTRFQQKILLGNSGPLKSISSIEYNVENIIKYYIDKCSFGKTYGLYKIK